MDHNKIRSHLCLPITKSVSDSQETNIFSSEHKSITASNTSRTSVESLNSAVEQSRDNATHRKESHGDASQTSSLSVPNQKRFCLRQLEDIWKTTCTLPQKTWWMLSQLPLGETSTIYSQEGRSPVH